MNIVLEKPTAASVEVAPRRRGARLVTGLLVTCGLAVALTISPPAPWSALGAFGAADDDAWRETSPQGTVSGLGTSTCVNMTIASYGVVTIELTDSDTPVTVANFLAYVDEEFYDGTVFHRVISNFMIQGGGMDSSLNTKRNTLPAIVNEAKNGLSNTYGTISMARTSDPDSATDEVRGEGQSGSGEGRGLWGRIQLQ